jgi:hypothetical protein
VGPALVIAAGSFLACCLLGQSLPAPLNHRGSGLEQVVAPMAFAGRHLRPLRVPAIMLRWTYSVETVVWEEDWADAPPGLRSG